jgi:hypothetical protein
VPPLSRRKSRVSPRFCGASEPLDFEGIPAFLELVWLFGTRPLTNESPARVFCWLIRQRLVAFCRCCPLVPKASRLHPLPVSAERGWKPTACASRKEHGAGGRRAIALVSPEIDPAEFIALIGRLASSSIRSSARFCTYLGRSSSSDHSSCERTLAQPRVPAVAVGTWRLRRCALTN